ncbi:V8-like protein Glu-specific endopeptidase-like protein [Streptomyces davaonensis JCM 4913]|uniref:V8-like protein Glu-specific endopeptidase-like protein n=1 Tax=Streptomyces davaonensis (strain DSM 101723 / JCM 4913 / KCC S-0913 / 768) TaxID=1214101 RepID=K4RGK5_STRDJ|nr:serine protease [Streptomyces davaonensis]CCK32314.1 V8-like protein Glu-specific endopeptidase-like protein [Streptomyces davaonensis JCM 4913]
MPTVDMPAGEMSHEEQRRQVADAARRYRESAKAREQVEARAAQGVPFPDTPQELAARAERILSRGGVPTTAVVDRIHAEPLDLPQTHERIIGLSNDLQAANFLPRGARAARTVARISLRRDGRELPLGTGFLVSPRLLMTNHHVLPDADFAATCFAEFDAQIGIDNSPDDIVRFEFAPAELFLAHEPLDFALVALAPADDAVPPGEIFGWNRLSVRTGKLVLGELVNVIGHPSGRLKEIALRDNKLVTRLDDFLHYRTDTEPGNSGSPVFNDQWEVVALHHLGVPETDASGRPLRKDGTAWQQGDGEDTLSWVANEGVRVSSVLRHLASLRPTPAQRALLTAMGPESGLGGPPPHEAAATVGDLQPAGLAVAERTAATGLRARGGAFGGERHLVFLHGRSQQGKNPEALRREWAAGLNKGLTHAGLPTLDPADAWFPYYGDQLANLIGGEESVAGTPPAEGTEVYEQLLLEAATRSGMPDDGPSAEEGLDSAVRKLRRALGWVAARSDLDEWTIDTVFRDVAKYLSEPRVRDGVLDTVAATLPDRGELVFVTHSLGTVVGMDLLSRLPSGIERVALVTVGSPLGMDAVNRGLLAGGPHRPKDVHSWVNAWCPADAVAIGCPLRDRRWGGIDQPEVVNGKDRAHNIAEYLGHATVAGPIGRALH